MSVVLVNDAAFWNRLVAERATGTFFHRYEWGKLMELLPGVGFFPYAIKDQGECHLVPVFHQDGRWSWSMLGYGGPCVRDGTVVSFRNLSARLERVQGGATRRIGLACGVEVFSDVTAGQAGWGHRDTHVLALPDRYDKLWSSCSGKARTGVRYARKHGVQVRELERCDLMDMFSIYNATMNRLAPDYRLSIEFFLGMCRLIPDSDLSLIGAFVDGELISASVFLFEQRRMYYWLHATTPLGRTLQASYLLLERGFQIAIRRGIHFADLGSSHDTSVARPKEYWGARPRPCLLYQAEGA